ncbi:hypothetical protein [Exiguobacterium sp. SH0S7]|uniref:hypothetical protein n=1 Tax=Exiguobacterium sp. SH0S7 TaxID=2510951 RepID=UPI0013153BEA|nr:hypothetical protein [Exiguobacterium sp. SH0S7]
MNPRLSEREATLFESKDRVIYVSYLITRNIQLSPEYMAEAFEVVEQLFHHVA